jgi:hypothetical protein
VTGRLLLRIGIVGLTTGVLTQLGQGALPDGWSQVANAIAPWLFVAFLLGSTMPDTRWAAGAGVGALVLALVGYYAMVELRFGYGASTNSLVLWGTAALAGGVVFGPLGRWWRVGTVRQRAIAIGMLAAVAVAEGVYLLAVLPDARIGVGFIIAGLVVPLLAAPSWTGRLHGYAAMVPALALGAVGYVAFLGFYRVVTGV